MWGMDRASFRRIILTSRIEKREKFEATLEQMEIFQKLSAAQRASIADCLISETFEVIADSEHRSVIVRYTPLTAIARW